jgi:hypothetical protein
MNFISRGARMIYNELKKDVPAFRPVAAGMEKAESNATNTVVAAGEAAISKLRKSPVGGCAPH